MKIFTGTIGRAWIRRVRAASALIAVVTGCAVSADLYDYNLADQLATVTYSGGGLVYVPDECGNILQITTSGSAPPVLAIDAPVADATVSGNPFSVSGTSMGPVAAVYYQLNSGPWQTAAGTAVWHISLNLILGANTVKIYAVDGTGAQSDMASFSVNCTSTAVASDVPLLPLWAAALLIVGLAAAAIKVLRGYRAQTGGMSFFTLFALIALACGPVRAEFGPGWHTVTSEDDVTYSAVDGGAIKGDSSQPGPVFNGFSGPITTIRQTGQPVVSEEITPEITALARNLENDPKRIYDYVHNYIKYTHYFGSKKGALVTLLEGSGNDFDQCALLAALIRAAEQNAGVAYTVTYEFGIMPIPYQSADNIDLMHWLGLNVNESSSDQYYFKVMNALNSMAGYPLYNSSWHAPILNNDYDKFVFHRVWLKLVYPDNSFSYLDPAFKTSTLVPGIDIKTAMQFDANNLLSQAGVGATITSDYVQNLNWNNVASALGSYTANLLADLQQTHPNLAVEEVISEYRINEQDTVTLPGLPFAPSIDYTTVDGVARHVPVLEWDNIPAAYLSTFRLQVDNIDVIYPMPSLKDRKVTLTFSGNQAVISLDDTQDKKATTGSGTTATMTTSLAHPFGTWNYTSNSVDLSHAFDQTDFGRTNSRSAPGYVIGYGFDDPNQRLIRRQQKLDGFLRQGLATNSVQVVTETLNVIGLSWVQEVYLGENALARQLEIMRICHHTVGRVAQESPTTSSFYVDFPLGMDASLWRSGIPNASGNPSQNFTAVAQYAGSAMEHGVIEQLQGVNSASTVRNLYQANTNHQRLILATPANSNTVLSILSGEIRSPYTSTERKQLLTNLATGMTMLLPSGKNSVGSWQGYGFSTVLSVSGGIAYTMQIQGGYHGAYPCDFGLVDSVAINEIWKSAEIPPATPTGDPVNMLDGSFMYDSADLSTGQAEPRGFTFSRHYDSNRRHQNAANMANGWTHNYIIQATERSDAAAALGKGTPQAMAAYATAMRAAYEVYSGTPDATNPQSKRWAVAALIAEWAVDQLKNNAVSVTMGSDTVQFIKQPGGSYTPPPGLTMTLTKPNGYVIQQRHGNTFNFDPTTRKVASIVDLYGETMSFNYTSGRLGAVVDCWGANKRTLTLTYNTAATPQLTTISDGTGRSVTLNYGTTYNTAGDLLSALDVEGKTWSFEYDADHGITKTKDPLSRVMVQNTYDSTGIAVTEQLAQGDAARKSQIFVSGRASVQKDPQGGRTLYYFDERNRQTRVTDATGKTSVSWYDGQDHLVKGVSPMGEVAQYTYDGRNNLTKTVDPLLNPTSFGFDANDDLRTVTDPRGKVTSYTYNAYHQPQTVTAPNINNDSSRPNVVSYDYYPGTGALKTQTDADSRVTTYYYDNWGLLQKVTCPNSDFESFVNDNRGNLQSHTDTNTVTTSFTYNKRKQLLTSTVARASGNVVSQMIYDDAGNLWKTIDPNTNTTVFTYSATAKPLITTLATAAGTAAITNTYDARDWLVAATNALGKWTSIGYDAAGRATSATNPLQKVTATGYDDDGRVTWVKSALAAASQVVRYGYSPRGEQLFATNGAGRVVQHGFDASGNLLTLTNERSKYFSMSYYDDNRLWTSRTPMGKTTASAYCKRGMIETLTEPSLQKTTFLYDDRGRLQTKSDPVGSSVYGYDKNNNLLTHAENGRQIVRKYDELNRTTNYVDEAGNNIGVEYDKNGNLTRLIYPGGTKWVKYQYDALNHLTNVTDWATRVTKLQYDIAGRLTNIIRPNLTSRRVGYDDANRVTSIQELDKTGGTISAWVIQPDEIGRSKTETVTPARTVRLEPARSMTYDGDNRVLTFNGQSVVHDDDGNMTTGPIAMGGAFVNYVYDSRNRLQSVGPQGAVPALAYGYNSEGHRTRVTRAGKDTTFVVNPVSALSQVLIRTKGGTNTYYIYGAGLLYQVDDSGNTQTYHYDPRGSTAALTDEAGAVTDRVEYSPYGMVTKRAGTTDTPFLYNGRFGVMTDDNGLLFMRARYYNPVLCRFVNADPIGLAGGLNWYAYANGNPIDQVDPFGLCAGGVKGWVQQNVAWPLEETADAVMNFGLGILFTPPGMPTPQFNPIQNITQTITGHPAYIPSETGAALQQMGSQLAKPGQDVLTSFGGYGQGLGVSITSDVNSQIPTIGGRKPINSSYAGGMHPSGVDFT